MSVSKVKKFYPVTIASTSFFLSYYTRLTWSILSVYVPFHPSIVQDTHVFSLYFFSYILVQIPAGFLSDKYSGGRILFFSLMGLAASSFFSGMANNIVQEYIASFLMGFFAGWIYPASLNVMNFYYKEDKSVFLGYYSIAWPFAIVIIGIVLVPVAINFGWRFGYYSAAIFCTIFAFLSYGLKTDKIKQKLDFSIIKNKNVILVSVGGFLFFFSYWSLVLFAYKYFISIGISDTVAGFIFSSMAIAGIFSSAISGFLVNKCGLKQCIVILFLVYAFLIASFSFVHSAIVLIIVSLLMGFIRFAIVPVNAYILTLIGKNKTGSATGVANLFWQSSGIFAPLLSSFVIVNFGFKFLWIIISAFVLFSILFYIRIKTTK